MGNGKRNAAEKWRKNKNQNQMPSCWRLDAGTFALHFDLHLMNAQLNNMVWHIMTGPTNLLPFLEYILSDKYSRSLKDTRLRH